MATKATAERGFVLDQRAFMVAVPEAQADETLINYGARLLRYLVTVDGYGYLTDEQLALAEYAAPVMVAAHDIDVRAVNRISEVRHRIQRTLDSRQAERWPEFPILTKRGEPQPVSQSAEQGAMMSLLRALIRDSGGDDNDRPDGGKLSKLQPRPKTGPTPTGVKVEEIEF